MILPLIFPGTDETHAGYVLNVHRTIVVATPTRITVTIDGSLATRELGVISDIPADAQYVELPAAGDYTFYLRPNGDGSPKTWYVYSFQGPGSGTYDGGLSGVGSCVTTPGLGGLIFVAYPNPLVEPTGAPLGELSHAEAKSVHPVYQAPGQGMFSINRHSPQGAWCVQHNYIRVYRDTWGNNGEDPVCGFFIETSQDVVVSEDEEGGEHLTLGGRGSMKIHQHWVLQEKSYLPPDSPFDLTALPEDDPDGMWHWTRNAGSILTRCLEEAFARDVNPMMDWDFDRDVDSNGDAWASDPDPPVFKLPVGDDGLKVIGKLQQQGLIVAVTPDFVTRAWDTDQGVHTGLAFTKGVNIRESADRAIDAFGVVSDMLVQGDAAVGYRYRNRGDSGVRTAVGKREGFLEFGATPTASTLDRAGDRAIAQLKRRSDGPTVLGVIEDEGAVALVDYSPGDYVTVDIPDIWDEVEAVIAGIVLTESETGETEAAIEFAGDSPIVSAESPVGSGCGGCQGTCRRTETFEGVDDVTLREPYVPRSVEMTLDGEPATGGGADFEELSPSAGTLTVITGYSVGVITYVSANCQRSTVGMHAAVDPGGGATLADLLAAMRDAGMLV